MWPTWWWPQALMQPEILILSGPMSRCRSRSAKALGDLLGDRDRARRRERAIVHARAGDDVGDEPDVGGREPGLLQPLRRSRGRCRRGDVRQDQVLLVADADLVVAVGLGEIGDEAHLLGGGVARRAADRLQRDRDDRRSGRACARRRWCRPRRAGRRRAIGGTRRRPARRPAARRRPRSSATSAGLTGRIARLLLEERGLDPLADRLEPSSWTRIFEPRLVLVVAPAAEVVDVQDRLEVGQQVGLRQEVPHHLGDHRGAAEAAADADLVADLARVVADDAEADVVRLGHRPVVRRAGDADLELARQVEELRVVGRPLAEQLGRRARILDLVGGGAGEMVGGDVADAVARRSGSSASRRRRARRGCPARRAASAS